MGLRIPRGRRLRRRASSLVKYAGYKTGLTHLPYYPDRMYLETTNACNLKCVMCPNGIGQMKRKRGFIEWNLYKAIVDEMAGHVKMTTLHIWGEPLLHPKLPEMIAYAHQKGMRTEISTNATLLNEGLSREILKAGLGAIYMCLDGATAETYESIRRRGDFEQTKANIQRFIELRREVAAPEPLVNVQIIEMQPTLPEVEAFTRQWRQAGVYRVSVKPFDSWGNQVDTISVLRASEANVPAKRWHCPNLWFHAHIYWDGTLVCCDRDFDALYPLGNVGNGVMKAWNGPAMRDLRRKHLHRRLEDVPSCRNCVEWAWWRPAPFESYGNRPQG
jgi:pyruvate-formate lyase-activating enzyme